jgi:type IV pilus assembly protein PilA
MSIRNRRHPGFTLIELMVVVAVVAILAMLAIPSYQDRIIRQQVAEGVALVDFLRQAVQGFYTLRHTLPVDNADAGVPAATQIVGNYVSNVTVSGGAFTITYGNRANPGLAGKQLTLRPAVVDGAPMVPIAWVCGHASVPAGMTVMGVDATSLPVAYLPLNCR